MARHFGAAPVVLHCAPTEHPPMTHDFDLITLGAYSKGTSPEVDAAIAAHDPIRKFLTQDREQGFTASASWDALGKTAEKN